MILHHYKVSPFSEKIRAMLGYSNMNWQSANSPAAPPRPIIDPLAGGYRRIPIAQIGADIFCDTRQISTEIARLSGKPELALENCASEVQDFVQLLDNEVFMAVATSGSTKHGLLLLAKHFTPWSAYRLLKDRAQMAKNSNLKRANREASLALVSEQLATIETMLENAPFLFGEQPNIADFAAYHVLWFKEKTAGGNFLKEHPATAEWLQRIRDFGHAKSSRVTKAEVFATAKNAEPRVIPAELQNGDLVGAAVSIAPNDYALTPVTGTLVGNGTRSLVLARETADFGTIHVHFPTQGYDLKRLTN